MSKKPEEFETYLRQIKDGISLDEVVMSIPERDRDEMRALLALVTAIRSVPHADPISEIGSVKVANIHGRENGRVRWFGVAGLMSLVRGIHQTLQMRVSDAAVNAGLLVTLGVLTVYPILSAYAPPPPDNAGGHAEFSSARPVVSPPTEEAEASGEPEEPVFVATPPVGGENQREDEHLLSFYPEPLGGAPPYEADLRIVVWEELHKRIGECESVTWDFGDGVEAAACPQLGARQYVWTTRHTYARPGTYYPRISMKLADGRVLSNFMPQTVVVAEPQAEPARAKALRLGLWAGAIAAAAAVGVWLWHRPKRTRLVGLLALGTLLTAAVPPFSYLPNPVGIGWRIVQRYSYDSRLPFVNRFLVASDPSEWLSLYLDAFIGQTGLDPLNPRQPLVSYEFLKVTIRPESYAIVKTRMTYADGSQLTYDIFLGVSRVYPFGFYQADWRYDGLQGLRLERRELDGIPFAENGDMAPLHLGLPELLFETDAEGFDELQSPFDMAVTSDVSHMRFLSPDGQSMLMLRNGGRDREFLIVSADGTMRSFDGVENVGDVAWLSDSRGFVYTTFDLSDGPARITNIRAIVVSLETGQETQVTELPYPGISALNEEGIWYIDDGALWAAPLDGSPSRQISGLGSDYSPPSDDWVTPILAPAPDGSIVAYGCGNGVCIQNRDGSDRVSIPPSEERLEGVSALEWNAEGSLLAATWPSAEYGVPATPSVLVILARDGTVVSEVSILPGATPGGAMGVPQWTPGKDWLLLQAATQFDGRHIIAVDARQGTAYDLSQPLWDAWAWAMPDGDRVLLYNGRGNFWISSLVWNESYGTVSLP